MVCSYSSTHGFCSRFGIGSRGFGNLIPPNSALVFDVELVELDSNNPREEL